MDMILRAPDTPLSQSIQDALSLAGFDTKFIPSDNDVYCLTTENIIQEVRFTPPFRPGALLDAAKHLQEKQRSLPLEIKLKKSLFYPEKAEFISGNPPKIIPLTEKECHLIAALWRAHPQHLTKEDLLEQVWGHTTELETHTLETHIYRLRQKIEADPTTPKLLITEKEGYKLDLEQ